MNEKVDRPLPGVHVGAKKLASTSRLSRADSIDPPLQNPSIEQFATILREWVEEVIKVRQFDETQLWLASSYVDAIMFKDGQAPDGITKNVASTVDHCYFVLRRKVELKGFQEPFQLTLKQLTERLKYMLKTAADKKGWKDEEKSLAIAYGIALIKKNARRPAGRLDQYIIEVVRRRFTLCYMLMEADFKDRPPLPGTQRPWFQQIYEATKPYVERLSEQQ